MDTNALDNAQIEAEAETRLPQPSTSKLSAVINGMGNGATVGVATYALPRAYAALRHKPLPAENFRGSIFATIVGTAIGTWYGLHEAKQIEAYRDKLGSEIVTLHERVHVLEGKHPQKQPAKLAALHDQLTAGELAR